jgi:hypothetical protein
MGCAACACGAGLQRTYRGSAEEKTDLLRYYTEFKGDMNKVGGDRRGSQAVAASGARAGTASGRSAGESL